MTRDEAINVIKSGIEVVTPKTAGQLVDVLAKLGMLKLDEPKSAEARAIDLLAGASFQIENSTHIYDGKYALTKAGADNMIQYLRRAGLKIVDRQV